VPGYARTTHLAPISRPQEIWPRLTWTTITARTSRISRVAARSRCSRADLATDPIPAAPYSGGCTSIRRGRLQRCKASSGCRRTRSATAHIAQSDRLLREHRFFRSRDAHRDRPTGAPSPFTFVASCGRVLGVSSAQSCGDLLADEQRGVIQPVGRWCTRTVVSGMRSTSMVRDTICSGLRRPDPRDL